MTQEQPWTIFINQFGDQLVEFQGYSNGGFYFGRNDDYLDIQVTLTPITTEGMEFGQIVTLNKLVKLNASVYIVAMGRPAPNLAMAPIFEGEASQNMRVSLQVLSSQQTAFG